VTASLTALPIQRLVELEGTTLGVSQWHEISQEMVNAFAVVTSDEQWIHVDPVRAAGGPFGTTIVHGYFTLSLFTPMLAEVVDVTGVGLVLNKGIDKLRFSAPVPVGSRIRAEIAVVSVKSRPRNFWEVHYGVTVRVEDQTTAALTAETIFLYQQN
jgi:acyl dehydratase